MEMALDYYRNIWARRPLVFSRGVAIGVYLNYHRPANSILAFLGGVGTIQLRLEGKKSPIRYSVCPRTLVSWRKIRIGIAQKNKTTRANTDTRLGHKAFFIENANRKIAMCDLGRGDGLQGFHEYLEMVSGGAMAKAMLELKVLMIRQPIARTVAHIEDRILKLLSYGGQQLHVAQIKLARIRGELQEFVRKMGEEEESEFPMGNYTSGGGIRGVVNDLRFMYKTVYLIKDTGGIGDS